MFEKLIGVSPPQKGKAQESKQSDDKNLRGTSKSEYKKDFEKALEKKLAQKKENLDNKKEETRRNEESKLAELRADKKDKRSLGGTKKKVTEDDDKIVSNVTASNESKVETPASKKEEPAKIKVATSEKTSGESQIQQKVEELKAQPLSDMGKAMASVSVSAGVQPLLENVSGEVLTASTATPILAGQSPSLELNSEIQNLPKATAQAHEAHQSSAPILPAKGLSLEKELGDSVGFKSDANIQRASSQLTEKLKAFETDKAPTLNKLKSFEKDVLSQLQKEQSFTAMPVADQSALKQEAGGFERQDSEPIKDLKSDLISPHGLHQAANQSHSEFKAGLDVSALSNSSTLAKLEENREANINEIMNQAQYLVKKGGGEVSVKMNPEGLGEVHLKVLLIDGKLNVEMQTQNKDVKKLIEDSLSDLKSGLAAHRLSLEHVKIDSVNATNADNNTQFQSNLNHGGNEGRARDFWNQDSSSQMNQQKQNSGHKEASLQPSVPRSFSNNVASSAQVLRTYGGTKGASINRVA